MIKIKAIKFYHKNNRVKFGFKINRKKYFVETSDQFLDDPETLANIIKQEIFNVIHVEVNL